MSYPVLLGYVTSMCDWRKIIHKILRKNDWLGFYKRQVFWYIII